MEEVKVEKLRHPKGLYLISFVTLWERFSFYGLSAFLILFMTNKVDDKLGGLGMDSGIASIITMTFMGLCYLLSLPGGRIADRYLGKRRSIVIGGLLIMLGLCSLALDFGRVPFFTGLALICIGNGFFKPSASSMVGDLYEQGDKRKDSAYTIFYMVFNGGAFAAPIVCGYLNNWRYQYGFLTIAIGMVMGLIIYLITAKKYLGNVGVQTIHKQNIENKIEKKPLTKEEKKQNYRNFYFSTFCYLFLDGIQSGK